MGRRRIALRVMLLIGIVAASPWLMFPALGRDLDGRYEDSPLHEWFERLVSGKGLCCSYADGYVVADADWDSKDGHYRVRVPEAVNSNNLLWVDVPNEAVITEANNRADDGLAAVRLSRRLDPLLHAGQHDLDGKLHNRCVTQPA
jgi:hypothetical protein